MSKKDEIIRAAIREFGEYSYDNASINRIINASGTSKGTFYHYFRGKKELYFSIIEDTVRIKQDYFSHMMRDVRKEDIDFFDMMRAQAKAGLEFMHDNPELYRFGAQFAKEKESIQAEFHEKYMPDLSSSFKKIVEAGVAAKTFSKNFPTDFITRIISYTMMNYYDILFDSEESPAPEKIEQRLDMLFDFMKRGFS